MATIDGTDVQPRSTPEDWLHVAIANAALHCVSTSERHIFSIIAANV